jgi:hypothetical protein
VRRPDTPQTITASNDAAPLRAEILAEDVAVCGTIVATGHAPVLKLCRMVVAAGHDPGLSLEAWRGGDVLCLRVRSIGEAATLEVRPAKSGTPVFVHTSRGSARAASPMRGKEAPAIGVPPRRSAYRGGQAHVAPRHRDAREGRDRKRRAAP